MTETMSNIRAQQVPTQRPDTEPQLWTPGAQDTATVMIGNIEQILVPGGHATDELAAKVGEISPRIIWYGGLDKVIVPERPDPDFVEYAASLGFAPEVVVPRNMNMRRLAIREGFDDPAVREAVRGEWVESYIGDRALYLRVTEAGGRYGYGDPKDSVRHANDKGRFADFASGIVAVPPGTLEHGIDKIARAVLARVKEEGAAFVRLVESGGNLGNRLFKAAEIDLRDEKAALKHVRDKLGGTRPDLWEDSNALVEEYLTLLSTPSTNFNTETDDVYEADQITWGDAYLGAWLPAPAWRGDHGQIREIGQGVRDAIKEQVGYRGRGGVDLGRVAAGSVAGAKNDTIGFEVNARSVAPRHVISIGEQLLGSYDTWRDKGYAVKALDHFELGSNLSFAELRKKLDDAGLLASPNNPFGVVISIPPASNVAGIVVLGKGYEATEMLYRRAQAAVGHPTTNKEKFPIFSQDMKRI